MVARELAPLIQVQAVSDAALRGALHQLAESAGVVIPGVPLPAPERARLKSFGVVAGRFGLFMPAMLKPQMMTLRAQLWAVSRRMAVPALPAGGVVSLAAPPDWPPGFAEAMGWFVAGPVLLRLDVAERIAAELAYTTRRGPAALPPGLAPRLSVRAELLPAVLRALGARMVPAAALEPDAYGPPAPPMLAAGAGRAAARGRTPRPAAAPPLDGPFAALASLRR